MAWNFEKTLADLRQEYSEQYVVTKRVWLAARQLQDDDPTKAEAMLVAAAPCAWSSWMVSSGNKPKSTTSPAQTTKSQPRRSIRASASRSAWTSAWIVGNDREPHW